MNGGDLYGKGVKGVLMDLACVDNKSFCYEFIKSAESHGLPEITVYTLDNKHYRLNHAETLKFISVLAAAEDILVKKFTRRRSDAAANFQNEFEGMQILRKIFRTPKELKAHTTAAILYPNILGFVVDRRDHYILNRKCGQTVIPMIKTMNRKTLDQMLKDVLETLVILGRHDYYHTDLKLDNILWCEDTQRFTIIDWEHGLKKSALEDILVKKRKGDPSGSQLVVSPISLFLETGRVRALKYSNALSIYLYMNLVRKQSMTMSQSSEYNAFYEERIRLPAETEIAATITDIHNQSQRAALFRKYHRNFDVFSVGICLALIYFIKKLPKVYLDLAETMVNVSHPDFAYTPEKALKNFRRLV